MAGAVTVPKSDNNKTNGTNSTSTTETKPQKYQPNALMKLKTYLTALRPWSLSGT